MTKPSIFITGFMGSGKSRVGRLLAQKLSRKHIDTDKLIESKAKLTIEQIFKQHGEPFFRNLELETIQSIDPQSGAIISLGGGASMQELVQKHIQQGMWVYLDTDFETIQERVLKSTHRPLGKDPQKLQELYKQRLPIYRKAPIIIASHGDSEYICQELIQRILKHANP